MGVIRKAIYEAVGVALDPIARVTLRSMHTRREIATNLTIAENWLELVPDKPLAIEKRFQEVSISLDECRSKLEKGILIFADGTIIHPKTEIFVEIEDEFGNIYKMESGSYGVNDFDHESDTCLVHQMGFKKRPNDLPMDRNYTLVRLRSEKPFKCSKIVWHNYNLK